MTTTTTQAEQIAARFANDGMRFQNAAGENLDAVCDEIAAREWRDGYRTGDVYRYRFTDGSAIVVDGDGWDVEGPEPFSWAGA